MCGPVQPASGPAAAASAGRRATGAGQPQPRKRLPELGQR